MLRLKEFRGQDLSCVINEVNRQIPKTENIISINEHLSHWTNTNNETIREWTLRVYYKE